MLEIKTGKGNKVSTIIKPILSKIKTDNNYYDIPFGHILDKRYLVCKCKEDILINNMLFEINDTVVLYITNLYKHGKAVDISIAAYDKFDVSSHDNNRWYTLEYCGSSDLFRKFEILQNKSDELDRIACIYDDNTERYMQARKRLTEAPYINEKVTALSTIGMMILFITPLVFMGAWFIDVVGTPIFLGLSIVSIISFILNYIYAKKHRANTEKCCNKLDELYEDNINKIKSTNGNCVTLIPYGIDDANNLKAS